jgi:hypothetical protein
MMNPVNTTKRFVLRHLLAADGVPMPEATLEDACRALQPGLLLSDFHLALRELQGDGFIIGNKDELADCPSWALTVPKGMLRAKQL